MRGEYSRVIDDFVERSRLVLLKKPYIVIDLFASYTRDQAEKHKESSVSLSTSSRRPAATRQC